LVAVDDVQWLDSPSREVLTFAAPRLESSPVRFLLSKRPGRVSPLERAFGPTGLERLEVGPLSVGATRQLLLDRLGLSLPRRLLRRLVDSTLGNPLFALEVGRTLADSSTARRTLRPDVGSRRRRSAGRQRSSIAPGSTASRFMSSRRTEFSDWRN
jgi:predicted ATPase